VTEFDVVIKGGTVIDGRRTPRRSADIGIKDGRIAAIGELPTSDAERVLDASGLIVAPGFIDLHTHYDAQIFWDPYCSLSGWHGVTTVVTGNCGFGFAPVAPEMREPAMLSMSRTEAISIDAMRIGIPWDWVSFPQFLDSLERTPKSVNVHACVPLSPVVIWAMGIERAKAGEKPTDAELDQMAQIMHEAMAAGAGGWSAIRGLANHRDYDGTPLVTDAMDTDIFRRMARVLAERDEGMIKMTYLDENDPTATLGAWEELAELSRRPMVYDSISSNVERPERHQMMLSWLDRCRDRGLKIYGQGYTTGVGVSFSLADDFNLLGGSPAWRELTSSPEGLIERLQDPARRPALRTQKPDTAFSFDQMTVLKVQSPDLKRYENLTVAEVAEMWGTHPADAFCDLVAADSLQTIFYSTILRAPEENLGLRDVVQYPWLLLGISDGGAHQKFFTAGRFPTESLITFVRDNEWISLEEAHWRLSALPAECASFSDRGTLTVGSAADVVVYDFDNLEVTADEIVEDLPGGDWRRVQRARGYRYVLVNGQVTIEDDKETGVTSGRLIRS
jgi:N-acyl-D-amino-acid deacylase